MAELLSPPLPWKAHRSDDRRLGWQNLKVWEALACLICAASDYPTTIQFKPIDNYPERNTLMSPIYFDSIINVSITGAVARITLGVATPAKSADGKEGVVLRATDVLVVPIEGFLRSLELQEQVVKKMVDAGVLTKKESASMAKEPEISLSADDAPTTTPQ